MSKPAPVRLRQRVEELEQTSGDLCSKCGWRGVRGSGCAFCRVEELEGLIVGADDEYWRVSLPKTGALMAEARRIRKREVR